MRLAIFGASGRTGRPLVEQALAAGHDVTALVRSPARLLMTHQRLRIVEGDVLDAAAVDSTVDHADAVLSALGQAKGAPRDLMTVATRNIIAAMRRHRVKRIISLTGAGVAAPQDHPKLMNHIIKLTLMTLSGPVLRDAEAHAKLLEASGLDWTIVRGPMLNEGPHTGNYRVGWVGVNTGARIARADVADFMLKQLTDKTYLKQAPMISD